MRVTASGGDGSIGMCIVLIVVAFVLGKNNSENNILLERKL